MIVKSYLLLQQKRTSYCDWQSSGKIEVMDVSQKREPVAHFKESTGMVMTQCDTLICI